MADFFNTNQDNGSQRHIDSMKRVTNQDTGNSMFHIFVDNGDFYAVPCNETTTAAFNVWLDSAHTGDDDEKFLDAVANVSDESAYQRCATVVNARLEKVTDRLSTDGVHLYIDNDSASRIGIDPVLEDHLVKLMAKRASDPQAEYDFRCYAAFCENLYSNVDPDIRAQLVTWMASQDWLTFTEDGCFIGYRGAQMMNGVPCSIHQGPAIVDGVNVNGHVPNPDGAVVEMPRSLVQHDPTVGCASGLHVGTYDYAHGWAQGVLLTVKVNPRDVVSVPFECDASKVRVCRFEVLEHEEIAYDKNLDSYYDRPLSYGYDPDDWDDDYDEDGYDADGYDEDGYDEDGYDVEGYDRDGYDAEGYDADGYDAEGYDRDGYGRDGYDEEGYDEYGRPRPDAAPADEPAPDAAPAAGDLDGNPTYDTLRNMYDQFFQSRL